MMKTLLFVYDYTQKQDLTYTPVCYDKNIHIRFKNNYKEIKGLEDKLSFLLTILVSKYIYDNHISYSNINFDNVIDGFTQTSDYNEIITLLKLFFNFKGIKFLPKYKSVEIDQFALIQEPDLLLSLKEFLNKFNVSLYDYLLNNKYYLVQTTLNKNETNIKYKNKFKRQNKSNKYQLW